MNDTYFVIVFKDLSISIPENQWIRFRNFVGVTSNLLQSFPFWIQSFENRLVRLKEVFACYLFGPLPTDRPSPNCFILFQILDLLAVVGFSSNCSSSNFWIISKVLNHFLADIDLLSKLLDPPLRCKNLLLKASRLSQRLDHRSLPPVARHSKSSRPKSSRPSQSI